jgi:hypothetical protein
MMSGIMSITAALRTGILPGLVTVTSQVTVSPGTANGGSARLLTGHPAKRGRAQSVDRRHAVCRNFATDQELSRASAGNCQGFHATVQCSFAQLDPIRRGLNPTVCHLLRCISTGSSMATISPGGKLGVRFAGGDVNHSAGNGKDARPSAVKIARVKPAWAGLNER